MEPVVVCLSLGLAGGLYWRGLARFKRRVPGWRVASFGIGLLALAGALLAPATGGASIFAGVTAAGTAIGATTGAAVGGLAKEDFDDEFTHDLELLMRPATSALVVVIDAYRTNPDELLRRMQPLGGTVLRTNLSPAAEAKLQHALGPAA